MPRYTVVTSMKDEAPYLLEWVAHYQALGFDQIVIAANDCSDGTDRMLERLQELGLCHYIPNFVPLGARPHSLALKLAGAHPALVEADFALVVDADEFLIVKTGDHTVAELSALLDKHHADAMVISWRMFGSSGQTKFKDEPVLDRFTHCSDPVARQGIKTFFRVRSDLRPAIHFPKPKQPGKNGPTLIAGIDGSGRSVDMKAIGWNGPKGKPGRDHAEVAHFMIKSTEEYLTKIFRGDGLMNSNRHGLGYWQGADKNEFSDLSLEPASAAMKQKLRKLIADPELSRLHDAAVAQRKEKIKQIKSHGPVKELDQILRKSSQGRVTPEDEVAARRITDELSPSLTDKSRLTSQISDSRAWASRPDIRVNWFRRAGGKGKNFGDDLGPYLVSKILSRQVTFASVADADLVAIGSVLEQTSKAVFKARRSEVLHIWGSGLIEDRDVKLQPALNVVAVRGTGTKARAGLEDQDIPLGDPGIIVSRYIAAAEPSGKVGIVPHFTQRNNSDLQKWARANGATWIDPTGDVEKVVSLISGCSAIVSSSLHGLIVADSYGVPNCWLNHSGHKGYEFKFADYVSGIDRDDFTSITLAGLLQGDEPEYSSAPDLTSHQDDLIDALRRVFAD